MLRIIVGIFALAFTTNVACAEPIKRSIQTDRALNPFTATQIDDQHPLYYQIIVTYCPEPLETPLEPTSQGKSYDDEIPPTMEERKAALKGHGCLDVPVPMEYLLRELTVEKFINHGGAQITVEFQQKRQDLRGWVVGLIQLHLSEYEVTGVANQ
jgi:hypothetical protein